MKPIIAYICFNRMGSTVVSLSSLLKTKDDFDLYIGDNDSRDKTFEFLKSLKDPRIKEVKRFERNYGEVNVSNWVLSKRKPGQDFIIMENDCLLHSDSFVGQFDEGFRKIPNCAALAACFIKDPLKSEYFHSSTLMGMFTCIRGDLMDQLGFYCEECLLNDIEMNNRIILMGLTSGYINTVVCETLHPWNTYNCIECRTHQNVCSGGDVVELFSETRPPIHEDLFCNRCILATNTLFWEKFKEETNAIMQEKIIDGKQLYWDSYHSGRKIPEGQETRRKKYMEFYHEVYVRHLFTNGLQGVADIKPVE